MTPALSALPGTFSPLFLAVGSCSRAQLCAAHRSDGTLDYHADTVFASDRDSNTSSRVTVRWPASGAQRHLYTVGTGRCCGPHGKTNKAFSAICLLLSSGQLRFLSSTATACLLFSTAMACLPSSIAVCDRLLRSVLLFAVHDVGCRSFVAVHALRVVVCLAVVVCVGIHAVVVGFVVVH